MTNFTNVINHTISARNREEQLQFLRQSARLEESSAPYFVRGVMFIFSVLVFLFLFWAAVAEVEEIAQASGEVVPSGFTQVIQHFDGGIVKEILVKEGSMVKEGDIVVRLDGAGAEEELRKAVIAQEGMENAAKTAEEMFAIQEKLKEQEVSSQVRYLEARQARDQAENDLKQQLEVVRRLKGRVERLEIKAPVSGWVKGMKLNTIGEVVKTGDPLLEIVPTEETLIVDAHISPSDIGHVEIGQKVKVKVSSFDYGRFGAVEGRLEFITATTFDGINGEKYYRGRISLMADHVGKHTEMKIQPGMIVNAGIITGKKTILDYLFKPVQRALQDGLTEK